MELTRFPIAKTFNKAFNKGLRIFPNHPHFPTPGFRIPELQQNQLFQYSPIFLLPCLLFQPTASCITTLLTGFVILYSTRTWESFMLPHSSHLQHPHKEYRIKNIFLKGYSFTQVTHKPFHFELSIPSKQRVRGGAA